ncbi:hypothetical protein P7C70_g5057, partial [Phenoliferia sp. Uapishka_3]
MLTSTQTILSLSLAALSVVAAPAQQLEERTPPPTFNCRPPTDGHQLTFIADPVGTKYPLYLNYFTSSSRPSFATTRNKSGAVSFYAATGPGAQSTQTYSLEVSYDLSLELSFPSRADTLFLNPTLGPQETPRASLYVSTPFKFACETCGTSSTKSGAVLGSKCLIIGNAQNQAVFQHGDGAQVTMGDIDNTGSTPHQLWDIIVS